MPKYGKIKKTDSPFVSVFTSAFFFYLTKIFNLTVLEII